MTNLHALTAEMLESSAAGYAAAALAANERRRREAQALTGVGGAGDWRAWFRQRVLELAASVRVNEPLLFVRRAEWLRQAARARGADEKELCGAFDSLRAALWEELPQHLRALALETVDAALVKLDAPLEPDETMVDTMTPAGKLALRYLEACLAVEPERATRLVLGAIGELSPEDVYVDVLGAAQREIGRLWHAGDATVVEERLVSETTRHLMAVIAHEHGPRGRLARTALAASVSGNAHDIGLRIVTELYRLAGWRCIFLGASVPSEQLVDSLKLFDVDLVILAATLSTQLHEAELAIEAMRQRSSDVRILVGGLAFEGAPDLWRRIGADGYAAMLRDAVSAGNALVERTAP